MYFLLGKPKIKKNNQLSSKTIKTKQNKTKQNKTKNKSRLDNTKLYFVKSNHVCHHLDLIDAKIYLPPLITLKSNCI